jgi:DNA-binding transcriptional regulator YhcF (GntR family)
VAKVFQFAGFEKRLECLATGMQVSLNKHSDVPLHEQLAEQLAFLITTRTLRPGKQLPSVRAFARRLGIHHNTVSKSYKDLVERGWLERHPGSRLCVARAPSRTQPADIDLDDLINQTIRRARELGYSLQALRSQVLERLSAQPPDHILVVEREPELRQIMCAEICSKVGKPAESCTADELSQRPELSLGAQVVAPEHLADLLNLRLSSKLPCMSFAFAGAEEQLASIRRLTQPSVIGVASISKTLLKTARSLLAPVIGRRHTMKLFLLTPDRPRALGGVDVVFCDSVAISLARCRRKIPYCLISEQCLEDIAVSLKPSMQSRG